MTANDDLSRRLTDHYAAEAPPRAPDWVLESALSTIEDTRQRRDLLAPWRFPHMPTYSKLAAAGIAVIAVGAYVLWQLAPSGGPGGPSPAPSPTASPKPTATLAPTVPTYVPPALTGTFTSDLHGVSLSYPAGWSTRPATEPWTDSSPPDFSEAAGDLIFDPVKEDHLFLALASQPLGAASFDDWLTAFLSSEGCTRTTRALVEGADRAFGTDCDVVLFSADGRGYVIALLTSNDDADLRSFDASAWLEEVLATVQLMPADAVDVAPTASP
jgi:hypothetical protein